MNEPHRVLQLDEPLPRWFPYLPLLAIALWWPIGPFWASDDFIALHYAHDLHKALADFTGWQYGASDLWLFWRPLITLSFWFDGLLGGGNPFWAHLSNVLAHGASTLLMGLLWRRLLDDRSAFAAAVLWSIAPGHAGTIAWAVGRVDGHTTVWILLALWSFVRWAEGRDRSRALSVLATALALMSKELAFAVPLLCTLLGVALRGSLRAAWPHWLLLAAVLAFRVLWLGRFGGYSGTVWQPLPMAAGFCTYALDLLDPLRWADTGLPRAGAAGLAWLGGLPALLAAWRCLRPRSVRATGLVLLLFAAASAPVAGFFAAADNHHNLRYFYLASGALCGLLVAGGRVATVLAFAAFLPAFALARVAQHDADAESASLYRVLERETEGMTGPWFVAGLPHGNAAGTVVQLHFGVDRMLLPPFADRTVRLYAHRPLLEVPGVLRLEDTDGWPLALPGATTALFRGAEHFVIVPPQRAHELPLAIEERGADSWRAVDAIDLTSARLQQLKDGALHLRVRLPGVHSPLLRVTILTANGYLCAIVPDHAADGAADGELDLLRFLGGDHAAGIDHPRVEPANAVPGGAPKSAVLYLLQVPSVIDLQPSFPVWIEAGHGVQDANGMRFVVDFAARSLPRLLLDHDYARQVRRMDGSER